MKLQLYYPVYPMIVTQKFGDTHLLAYYAANGVYFNGHNGLDIVANHGQEVRATHEGIVEVQVDSAQGHGVVLKTLDAYDYKGQQVKFKTIYWHLIDNIPVTNGQQVKIGDLLGYADSTGLSTGDHLHYGLKPINPNGSNLEPDNGFQGAIDPAPYFIDEYAQDYGKVLVDHFTKDLQRGDEGEEVRKLQVMLAQFGYITPGEIMAPYPYGPRTQKGVYKFQLDFDVPLTVLDKQYAGKYFGPKTRKVANRLFR